MKAEEVLERTAGKVLDLGAAHALWAPTYDDGLNPLLALEERSVEPLLPTLGGKRVLDVACGTGRWLRRLLQKGPRLAVGMDLSMEMLDVASAKPCLDGKLARASVLALPIRDQSLDLAVCSFAVSYISDLSSLAVEFARISTSGADIFVSDFHPSGHERGWKRGFRISDRVIEIASVIRSLEAISEAFVKAGFKISARLEPSLGEPEREVFVRAGNLAQFDSVRGFPAIYILHLQFPA